MKANFKLVALGLVACSSVFGLTRAAQASAQCTSDNVAGDYGYTSSGAIVTPAVGPFTAVGRVTITEAGTFSGEQTTSIAGNLVDETISGSYEVSPDCTGTAIVFVYHGPTLVRTSHIHLVWDDTRREFRSNFQNTGTNISIAARRT